MLRVVIYARISDRKQLDSASLETQMDNCTKYAVEKGWLVVKVIQEVHTSIEYRERLLLSEARRMIRNGEVDVFLVNSLDRLARDMIHQSVLMDEMHHYNVTLESVTEDIDNSPLGQFMRQALGFAAAIEREKFLERSKRTINKRVAEGKLVGTGVANYGYIYNEDHSKYVINPLEATVVERIYRMRLDGIACKRIAIILNEEGIPSRKGKWGITSIFNILKNPVYYGKAQAHRVKFIRKDGKRVQTKDTSPVDLPEGTIPPIVSKETFDAIQATLESAKNEAACNDKNPQHALLRAGYIKCGYCGQNLQAMGRNRKGFDKRRQKPYMKKTYYMCNRARIVPKTCIGVTITADLIDDIVWSYIGSLLKDLSDIKQALELLQDKQEQEYDMAAIDRSIEKHKKELQQLARDMRGLEGYSREVLLEDMKGLEESLKKLEQEKVQALPKATKLEKQRTEVDNFLQWAEGMRGRYHEATYDEKRTTLRVLGITVHAYKEIDEEHERYEIKVGLMQLYSDLTQIRQYGREAGETAQ